jgi:hypothetical protein
MDGLLSLFGITFDRVITKKQNIWKLAQLPSPGLFVMYQYGLPWWSSVRYSTPVASSEVYRGKKIQ